MPTDTLETGTLSARSNCEPDSKTRLDSDDEIRGHLLSRREAVVLIGATGLAIVAGCSRNGGGAAAARGNSTDAASATPRAAGTPQPDCIVRPARVVTARNLMPRQLLPVSVVGMPVGSGIVSRATCLFLLVFAAGSPLPAQNRALSQADSALIGRILLAEDRRDATDAALALGQRHADTRIRLLAVRAAARTRDSAFMTRDSLPPLREPARWPNVAWRARYRALKSRGSDCAAIRVALADPVWPVRLRGADLVTTACAGDDSLTSTLRTWIDILPADVSRRRPPAVSWHAAAHALVALSKLRPAEATARLSKLARHGQWHLRFYSAHAAAILADTAALRMLARDANANVAESAIASLSKLTKHADDDLYLNALQRSEAQVVRVAALALAGSPRAEVRTAASAAFDRWVSRASASERDVRLALLAASGRPESDDRPPPVRAALPRHAIALALGADVRLRVTMSPASGGGSFTVRLRGDVAPMTAARIFELAEGGYYDGLEWHRVEHDFVIQGGSPGASEYVGSDRYFRDELGTVPHARGTVGMSTRGHDTGDAQWFVNLSFNPRLGKDYTVFAEVVERMDVVDGILEGDIIATIRRARSPARP